MTKYAIFGTIFGVVGAVLTCFICANFILNSIVEEFWVGVATVCILIAFVCESRFQQLKDNKNDCIASYF